jgi:hypothetical protein
MRRKDGLKPWSARAGRYTGSYLDRCNGWRAVRSWLALVKLHSWDAIRKSIMLCQRGDTRLRAY